MNPGHTFAETRGMSRPDSGLSGCRRPRTAQRAVPTLRAMSLIEMMVAVTLLVVIILGLTAMFNQTRKAFNIGLSNVDYQDAGRVAMDVISRDLQQIAPTYYSAFNYFQYINNPDNYIFTNGLNFYASPSLGGTNYAWPMTGGDVTNFSLASLYFLTRSNQQWTAVGYRLTYSDVANGIGTLCRFSTNNPTNTTLAPLQVGSSPVNRNTQIYNFLENDPPAPPASFVPVVDNVVDFRIRAYDRNGLLIPTPIIQYATATKPPPPAAEIFATNYTGNAPVVLPFPDLGYWIDPNASVNPVFTNFNISYSPQFTGDYQYQFLSNSVPAYVEIELGIMETPTVQQLQALTNSPAAYVSFLTNHAAQVHIFRQRITIPSTDPAAYP
jgi:hypothetical protein